MATTKVTKGTTKKKRTTPPKPPAPKGPAGRGKSTRPPVKAGAGGAAARRSPAPGRGETAAKTAKTTKAGSPKVAKPTTRAVTARKRAAAKKPPAPRRTAAGAPAAVKLCPSWAILLGEYALGIISDADRGRLERHLAICPRCADELAKLTGLYRLLAPYDLARPSASFVADVARALAAVSEVSPPRTAGEDVLAGPENVGVEPEAPTETVSSVAGPYAEPEVAEVPLSPQPAVNARPSRPSPRRPWWRAPWLIPALGGAAAGAVLLVILLRMGGPGDLTPQPTPPAEAPTLTGVAASEKEGRGTAGVADAGREAVVPARGDEANREVAADVMPDIEAGGDGVVEEVTAREIAAKDYGETYRPASALSPEGLKAKKTADSPLAGVGVVAGEGTGVTPRFEAVTGPDKRVAVERWMEDKIAADIERLTADNPAKVTAAIFEYVTPNGGVVTYVAELPPPKRAVLLARLKEEPPVLELKEGEAP